MNKENFNSRRRRFNHIVFISFLFTAFLDFSKKKKIIDNPKTRKNTKLKWILSSKDV